METRRAGVVLAAALGIATASGCGVIGGSNSAEEFQNAVETCTAKVRGANPDLSEQELRGFLRVGSDESLLIRWPVGEGLERLVGGALGVCALETLNTPDAIRFEMSNATPEMGRQESKWDGYEMTYSVDETNGFSVIIRSR